ncbi:shikimate dehydrogenase [Lacisediminihabitans profunda]|uniref:Shikimate dehydrogenase n=1 Tax=Lacisediminihabitans profunda TaxID=2594790 RepID=A0A5C8UV68_9MICO|nr:shikimate dehydrogenase [Lacisediminihabitans profunda]TXN32206.1 shikimate dehydrogenase [Lacisediminihabitans profunda]
MTVVERRLAVLGSPIAHSQSPALHRAAYAALGLPWSYDAIEVTTDALPGFLASCGPEWRGLSLTMPLKRDVLPFLDELDEYVEITGGANTVVFDPRPGGRTTRGFNTDVYGFREAFRSVGVRRLSSVRLLGGGATAASAMAAVAELGATRIAISARTPKKVTRLLALGDRLGVDVEIEQLSELDDSVVPDVVISTIPGSAQLDIPFTEETRAKSVLLEVAYDPWPTPLAASWFEAGGRVIPGIEMLVNQALMQVRIFVSGHPHRALRGEHRVFSAMRVAVGLDGAPE